MNEITKRWWNSGSKLPLLVFLGIATYFLWTEHQAHVIEYLPWVLILACVGMHFFMHGGHGSHESDEQHNHSTHSNDKSTDKDGGDAER